MAAQRRAAADRSRGASPDAAAQRASAVRISAVRHPSGRDGVRHRGVPRQLRHLRSALGGRVRPGGRVRAVSLQLRRTHSPCDDERPRARPGRRPPRCSWSVHGNATSDDFRRRIVPESGCGRCVVGKSSRRGDVDSRCSVRRARPSTRLDSDGRTGPRVRGAGRRTRHDQGSARTDQDGCRDAPGPVGRGRHRSERCSRNAGLTRLSRAFDRPGRAAVFAGRARRAGAARTNPSSTGSASSHP